MFSISGLSVDEETLEHMVIHYAATRSKDLDWSAGAALISCYKPLMHTETIVIYPKYYSELSEGFLAYG